MGNQKEGQGLDRPEIRQRQSLFGLCRHTIHGKWNLVRRPDADSHLSHPRRGTFSLGSAPSHDGMLSALTAAFILLCTFHGLLFAAAVRLPLSVMGGTETTSRQVFVIAPFLNLRGLKPRCGPEGGRQPGVGVVPSTSTLPPYCRQDAGSRRECRCGTERRAWRGPLQRRQLRPRLRNASLQ
jgi:hypothetical protein